MKKVIKFLSASFLFAVMALNANLAISADYKVALYILVLQVIMDGTISMM
jgi:hypothetical protein